MVHENLAKADWTDKERIERMAASYRTRYDSLFWIALEKLTGTQKRDVVADFGCGPGLFLKDALSKYSATKVIGLDESPGMIEYAKGLIGEHTTVGSSEFIQINFDTARIPVVSGTVNLAFCGFMLHEVRDPQDFVSQVADKLTSGGSYVVYDYVSGNEEAFLKAMMERGMNEERARKRYPHMCKHSTTDIATLMKNAGLGNIKTIDINDIRAVVIGSK